MSFEPGDIRAESSTYLRVGDGWVAWDAYREDGPYQIGWSLAAGSGRHQTNAGRSVTSAAVDPTGSYIAISETTTLSIGNARDVVYVLRTDDGTVVFRRYLPRYSRSEVVFFDGGLFGYSDLDGTHILKIPPAVVPTSSRLTCGKHKQWRSKPPRIVRLMRTLRVSSALLPREPRRTRRSTSRRHGPPRRSSLRS